MLDYRLGQINGREGKFVLKGRGRGSVTTDGVALSGTGSEMDLYSAPLSTK